MQRTLFKKQPLFHGGEHAIGKAKTRRPLSSKHSHHLVFRASTEVRSFLKKERREFILSQIGKWSKYFGIRIYAQSVNSNHLHLVVYSPNVRSLQNFMRVLPGQIAQRLGKGVSTFWESTIFSRIIAWGRGFKTVLAYVEKNTHEAAGVITYHRSQGPPRFR